MKHLFQYITICAVLLCCANVQSAQAQSNENHLQAAFGALYERGFDVTLSYEHETKYHNAWEYFANGYIKYDDDPVAGHITKESFWKNYRTWLLGIAYKPCVARGRNHHGNLRIGVMGGSDTDKLIGGGTVGYQHSYALRHGWELYFLVKSDVILRGEDLFRTGVELGFKVPL